MSVGLGVRVLGGSQRAVDLTSPTMWVGPGMSSVASRETEITRMLGQ